MEDLNTAVETVNCPQHATFYYLSLFFVSSFLVPIPGAAAAQQQQQQQVSSIRLSLFPPIDGTTWQTVLTGYTARGRDLRKFLNDNKQYDLFMDPVIAEHINAEQVPPFVSVAASSGTGKTQMAFAAPVEYKVIYIPLAEISLANGQIIYRPFMGLRKCLYDCIKKDLKTHHNGKAYAPTSSISASNSYLVAGLFSQLLDLAGHAPGDLLETRQIIVVKPITVQALAEKVSREKGPIRVILDEVTMLAKKEGKGANKKVARPKQQMLRSLLRCAGLVVVLMSTHSSVANYIGELKIFVVLLLSIFSL
jgi:hypothetical protein